MTQNSAHTGKLYVVGTPIGNLGDLSPRVGEAFAAADAICCEDTRVTSKLLMYLGISKPLVRCDENVIASRAAGLVDRLLAGETLAFASDAGMPSVSDPGQALVKAAREADVPVEVIPFSRLRHGARFVRHSLRAFFLRGLFRPKARRPRAPFAASCRGARRTHLLRVSTSHRGDARGRGGGLSPA